jgi:hypothetical protein
MKKFLFYFFFLINQYQTHASCMPEPQKLIKITVIGENLYYSPTLNTILPVLTRSTSFLSIHSCRNLPWAYSNAWSL